jgi:hypothetical protein
MLTTKGTTIHITSFGKVCLGLEPFAQKIRSEIPLFSKSIGNLERKLRRFTGGY